MPRADAIGISKAYTKHVRHTYMQGGRHGFRTSPRGRGGVQGPKEPMDTARGLWVRPQVSASYSPFSMSKTLRLHLWKCEGGGTGGAVHDATSSTTQAINWLKNPSSSIV
jgi:hypothetical protein